MELPGSTSCGDVRAARTRPPAGPRRGARCPRARRLAASAIPGARGHAHVAGKAHAARRRARGHRAPRRGPAGGRVLAALTSPHEVDPGSSMTARSRPTPVRLAVLLAAVAAGCSGSNGATYQGYVEGEFVYLASSQAGRLEHLTVTRGQQVEPGAPLF